MAIAKDNDGDHLGLRVLLIEDSIDTLNMLKLWLGTFGCEVLTATDALEGIKLAARTRPELIISDIGMPAMDGYELMRKLRKTQGLERVPAIALSGYDHPEDKELSRAAGYNAHLPKPTDMRKLLSLIKKLTRQ
jgi:two-component system CheB/CheR fusion protein